MLEQGKRLSESVLWQLQRNYFDQAGSLAWRNNVVPSHATSNAYIALAYAKALMGYMRDALTQGHRGTVHIVDLGAGSGQFAFHLLKKLDDLYGSSSVCNKVPYHYVIADFTQSNLDFCKNHPAMQSFIEAGKLDFALVDVTQTEPLTIELQHSGEILASGSVPGPMALIGNYLFDSIPQDLFYLKNHQVYECLPRLTLKDKSPRDMHGLPSMESIKIDYEQSPVDAGYYPEPHFNKLLDFYRDKVDMNHVTFPVIGLRFLDRLAAITQQSLLVLSADKGSAKIEQLYRHNQSYMAHHGGAFSLAVNYHLISQYAQDQGGKSWLPAHNPQNICVAGFLLGAGVTAFMETDYAVQEAVCGYNPDDFFVLKNSIELQIRHMQIPEILAYLRLSSYDSTVFMRVSDQIKARLSTASQANREDIKCLCQRVRENHYDLGHFNLEETIGSLLY